VKYGLHIVLFILLMAGTGVVWGQKTEGTHLVDAKILMRGTEINENFISINYEIPYSGMVEIRLFDATGQLIWRNQYDRPYGENRIVLRSSKLSPGATYAYQLNYKRDMVREIITLPGGAVPD